MRNRSAMKAQCEVETDEPPRSERRQLSALTLDDGTRAVLKEGGLEIQDSRGKLLVRYENGSATIEVPAGDLKLCAPKGRVLIQSAEDIVLEAERDVRQEARRKVTLSANSGDGQTAPQICLSPELAQIEAKHIRAVAERSQVVSANVEVIAQAIVTSAEQIVETATRVERTAHRLIERARDAFRDVTELSQSRFGRVRTIVRDSYHLTSNRTTMNSKEDTSIDGKRILLG